MLACIIISVVAGVCAAPITTGLDKRAAEQKFRALRWMDENGEIPPDALWRALEHRRRALADSAPGLASRQLSAALHALGKSGLQSAGIQTNGWTWLGPANIGGRVRSILIHPTLTNVLWCGSVGGGIWKSTNSGASWFALDDFMANLAVACMVMDPANADVIYAGTGEDFIDGTPDEAHVVRGAGIFKTSDGGATWMRLPSTTNPAFQYVSRLAIDPNNSQVILAATRSGLFRSGDGGATWTNRHGGQVLQVAFHPTDSSQCIAAGYNGRAFYSTNGGMNWTSAGGLPAPSGTQAGRVELAYSRSNPSLVFVSLDNNDGEIYRSTNSGHSYLLRNRGTNYLEGGGWWANTIWADPTSTNNLIVGGANLWRSTNGGATLTRISDWLLKPISAHVDQHAIVSSPAFDGASIKTVYFGDDGGIYRAADVYTVREASGWEDLNHNLGITQFYGGAGNLETGVIIGGTQDNGTLRYTPLEGAGRWAQMFDGDGGFCAADPTDPNFLYGEAVYLLLYRSTNGGLFSDWLQPLFQSVSSGITEAGSFDVNFIAPFILDPNNSNTMLAGGLSLWRSTNIKAPKPTWSRIKSSIGSPISAITVASGNSDIIWVGHNNGFVYSTTNGTAASPSWSRGDLGAPNLPKRYCGRITIDPANSNRLYVTFGGFSSGNVWSTSDSGVNWTDISGNLPAAPVNSIVIAPWDPNTLYIGTEVGVYATTDGGASWSTSNDGPANVAVEELFWLGPKLVAATHGRGMFYATPNPRLASPADLGIIGAQISGSEGNACIDQNEYNELYLLVKNIGGSVADQVAATLTTDTPGVSVSQASSEYDNLAPEDTRTNSTPFRISTSPCFVPGTPARIKLNLLFSGGSNSATFTIPNTNQNYVFDQTIGASIVPGTNDIGNHGLALASTIPLPFPYSFYDQTFTNTTIFGDGSIHFLGRDFAIGCIPHPVLNYAILAFSDVLRTDTPGSGIFTSLSGSAPHRIFNIEWRATYFTAFEPPSQDKGKPLNFEVRLYEDQPRFDIVYGELNGDGSHAGVGVQQGPASAYTSFECHTGGLGPGLQLAFVLQRSCGHDGWICLLPNRLPFILSPTLAGSEFSFSFETVPGKEYLIQFKDSLDDPAWKLLRSVAGDGTAQRITESVLANRHRFYRLSAQ